MSCHLHAAQDVPLITMNEAFRWNNSDNNAFYEELKARGLREIAEKKAGLASGCDLALLRPYWSKAKSILEVGAGYGRVIDCLLQHQFKGNITAIERCNALFTHLKKQYVKYENIHLLHIDIRNLDDLNNRFDLILMLWSGIADFPPQEQSLLFKDLAKLLQKKGMLVIDTMPANVIPLDTNKCGQQVYTTKIYDNTIFTYEPNSIEIKQYAKEAGFSNIIHITCRTDTNRERWLYILS